MFDLIAQIWFASRHETDDELAREIAARSVAQVRSRLSSCVSKMGDAELRGYVRARALRPVRIAADQLATQHVRQATICSALVTNALERVVHLVVHELKTQPIVAPSAVRATMRAAG